MTWGFPACSKGKNGQVAEARSTMRARTSSALRSGACFERRRCLIPVSAWAEAEGIKGQMTRTWYSLAGADVFAVGMAPDRGVGAPIRWPAVMAARRWPRYTTACPSSSPEKAGSNGSRGNSCRSLCAVPDLSR